MFILRIFYYFKSLNTKFTIMHALLWNTSDIDLFVHAEELYDMRSSDERLETELVRIDGSKPTGEKITIALRYAKSAD